LFLGVRTLTISITYSHKSEGLMVKGEGLMVLK